MRDLASTESKTEDAINHTYDDPGCPNSTHYRALWPQPQRPPQQDLGRCFTQSELVKEDESDDDLANNSSISLPRLDNEQHLACLLLESRTMMAQYSRSPDEV